ncbi:MAG: hypothetical protein LC803_22995 [Acidobacteria bacterium]|nr:hypothetical protein [Acidobacteriota bacterium]
MVDAEHAPDAAEVSTFQMEAHRFTLCLFWIAERLRLRRVDALTLFALVALAAGAGVSGFCLLL